MTPSESGYQSSTQKDAVRQHFDLPLLHKFSTEKGTKLAYFGMPGEECLDIRDWRSVIREVAAVERKEANLRKMAGRLRRRFKNVRSRVYLGDVDDVILSGHGEPHNVGGKPADIRVENHFDQDMDRRVWKFDVVNLDYFGRFFPRVGGDFPRARTRRPRALRHLFEQERLDARDSWLMLLTVEGGQYGSNDINHLVEYIESARTSDEKLSEAIDFLLAPSGRHNDPTIKILHAAVSLFIASAASHAQLDARPHGTVSYRGSGMHTMVHCAFQFQPATNPLGNVANPLGLLRAPIIRPVLGENCPRFEWASDPCPGTTKRALSECLGFLEPTHLTPLSARVAD